MAGITVGFGGLVGVVDFVGGVFGDRLGAVVSGAGVVEVGEAVVSVGADEDGLGAEVTMDDTAEVGVVEGFEGVAQDGDFLVEGEAEVGVGEVLLEAGARFVFGDEDVAIAVFGVEEFADAENIGMGTNGGEGAIGVADVALVDFAFGFGFVGIDVVDAETDGATAFAEEVVFGAVFDVFDRLDVVFVGFFADEFGSEFFDRLPVAELGKRAFGWGFADDACFDFGVEGANVAEEVAGDVFFAFEVGEAALVEIGDVVGFVSAAEVTDGGVGIGEEDDGVGVEFVEIALGGELVFDEGFEDFGVLAKFGQGGGVGVSPTGLPLVGVEVDVAEGAFDVDEKEAVGGDEGDIDFVGLLFAGAMDLEGMDEDVGVGKVVTQKCDCPSFGVVSRLSDRDDFCHRGFWENREPMG